MQMRVTSIEYVPNRQIPYLSQKHKGGSRPQTGDKILGGGNGTYAMLSKYGTADIIVWVETSDGNVPISVGAGIRRILDRSKLSKKMCEEMDGRKPETFDVEINDGRHLKISDEELRTWLQPK